MSENFIGGDPHDLSQNLDYFIWVATNSERTYVIDTGFNHEVAADRGRKIDRLPREGLELLGIDAGKVEDVIITHLHYDHAGTFGDFKNARMHLQDAEMEMATGRCMCHAPLRMPYHVDDVCEMVRKVYAEQVDFHDGDKQLAPGISVHLCAGHAAGLQSVACQNQARLCDDCVRRDAFLHELCRKEAIPNPGEHGGYDGKLDQADPLGRFH